MNQNPNYNRAISSLRKSRIDSNVLPDNSKEEIGNLSLRPGPDTEDQNSSKLTIIHSLLPRKHIEVKAEPIGVAEISESTLESGL
jgi:hypothetical protein